MFCFVATLTGLVWNLPANAEVRLPKIFSNSMVLQQGMAAPVWGWADAGEKVTVSFAGQQKSATADPRGKWLVKLDAMPASKSPHELIVAGTNTLTIKDVLVGEVWLCSGQSNMALTVSSCLNFDTEKTAATNPLIRNFLVLQAESAVPLEDVTGQWAVCSPDTVGQFSGAGYYFARAVTAALDAPVGIIASAWGSTRIEPWTPPEGFRAVPELKELSQIVDAGGPKTEPPHGKGPWKPVRAFNGMIAPLIPYAIRGALWYQGEANGDEGVTYYHKTKALILGWRQLWAEGDFPFYFCQLANMRNYDSGVPGAGDGWARTREAQLMSLSIPNTGMAVVIDLGTDDENLPKGQANIHPKNKQDVGKRLALWALAKAYGKDIVYSGPLYEKCVVEGNKIRVSFTQVGGGLMVGEKKGLDPVKDIPGGKLKGFAVAGADKAWQWADAVIDGNTVVVQSDKVATPVAVRYAFAMNAEGLNLYNKEGLPASPFRTDNW